ncbi:MAG: PGPGW domain-containing protein [Steroidobacteraceae bacterium]
MILGLLRSTGTLTYKWARRLVVTLIGGTVCLLGVAMLVLPGPGLLVIPLGLGILGLEFAFARRWLARVRESAGDVVGEISKRAWRRRPPPSDGEA